MYGGVRFWERGYREEENGGGGVWGIDYIGKGVCIGGFV